MCLFDGCSLTEYELAKQCLNTVHMVVCLFGISVLVDEGADLKTRAAVL